MITRIIQIIIFYYCINQPVIAGTAVGGIIKSDTVFDISGSPYELADDLSINAGVTLAINPGVVINGNNRSIYVDGLLKAEGGIDADNIVFNNLTITAGSIGPLNATPTLRFTYSKFYRTNFFWGEYCRYHSYPINSVRCEAISGTLNIDNSYFDSSGIVAVSGFTNTFSGAINVNKNIFISSGLNLSPNPNATLAVTNNVFYGYSSQAIRFYRGCYVGLATKNANIKYNSFLSVRPTVIVDKGSIRSCSGVIDMTENFWNTVNYATIEGMVKDYSDDPFYPSADIKWDPYLFMPHQDTPKTDFPLFPTDKNDGECGFAENYEEPRAPIYNILKKFLCDSGIPTVPTMLQDWRFSWSCLGIRDGNSMSCVSKAMPPTKRLQVTKMGQGHIISNPPGIDCGKKCGYDFSKKKITLSAVTNGQDKKFKRWGGACRGKKPSCIVKLRNNKNVKAFFQ